jgi:predicted esterase
MAETITSTDDYLVHFVHGKESGPWGSKISRLAEVARGLGLGVQSLDYSGIADPELRADTLIQHCTGSDKKLILVGSSMGGWVATRASVALNPIGLFLLAPAFLLPGYPAVYPNCAADAIEVVHGWDDDVILFEHAIRFGREVGCAVHLVKDGHSLQGPHTPLEGYFSQFLRRLLPDASQAT